MADNLVKRLRNNVADILDLNGKVMTAWDTVRAMISNGNKGSLPRDIIESYLYGYAEDMAEAADRIEQLETALRTIYDCCDETGNCSVVRRIVRKALEEKDD